MGENSLASQSPDSYLATDKYLTIIYEISYEKIAASRFRCRGRYFLRKISHYQGFLFHYIQ